MQENMEAIEAQQAKEEASTRIIVILISITMPDQTTLSVYGVWCMGMKRKLQDTNPASALVH